MTPSTAFTLPVAQIVPCTEAEGPGGRFALWVQGCPLRCPGCCNPEFLAFDGGEAIAIPQLIADVEMAVRHHDIEGITLLGGEPFAHAEGCVQLASAVRERGLSVMAFSGYTLAELRAQHDPHIDAFLSETDMLVDGKYDPSQPETSRRWIGSRNQKIHFLTNRGDPHDPRWQQSNTLEVRLVDGVLTVNGFPAVQARELWKSRRWLHQ